MSDKPKKWREWYITKSGRAYRSEQDLLPSDEVRINVIERSSLTAAETEIVIYKKTTLQAQEMAKEIAAKLTAAEREIAELKTIHSEVVVGALDLKKQNEEQAKELEWLKNRPVYDGEYVSSKERKEFEGEKEKAKNQVAYAEKLARENSIRAYEANANKECKSQAAAYGYAEVHHAKSDYDNLREEFENRSELILKHEDTITDLQIERNALEAKLARAREALEYYANGRNWKYTTYDIHALIENSDLSTVPDGTFVHGYEKTECGGQRARRALKEI